MEIAETYSNTDSRTQLHVPQSAMRLEHSSKAHLEKLAQACDDAARRKPIRVSVSLRVRKGYKEEKRTREREQTECAQAISQEKLLRKKVKYMHFSRREMNKHRPTLIFFFQFRRIKSLNLPTTSIGINELFLYITLAKLTFRFSSNRRFSDLYPQMDLKCLLKGQ